MVFPMVTQAGREAGRASRGFTLVELLLTVTLVLLLVGAMIFSFSTLQRGAQLEEGANQFEALVRFVRAYAANTGRQVQINFEEEIDDGLSVPLGSLRVLWEPDPIGQPGIFQPLPEAVEFVSRITDLISVEDVRPGSAEPNDVTNAPPSDTAMNVTFLPTNFYPDGSSDSAEILFASKDSEDERLISVRLSGVTGTVSKRRFLKKETGEEPEPLDEPAPEVVEAAK